MNENATMTVDAEEEESAYSSSFSPTISALVPAVLLAVTTPFTSHHFAKYKYTAPELSRKFEVTNIPTISMAVEENSSGLDGEKVLSSFLQTLLEQSHDTPRDIAAAIDSRLLDLL